MNPGPDSHARALNRPGTLPQARLYATLSMSHSRGHACGSRGMQHHAAYQRRTTHPRQAISHANGAEKPRTSRVPGLTRCPQARDCHLHDGAVASPTVPEACNTTECVRDAQHIRGRRFLVQTGLKSHTNVRVPGLPRCSRPATAISTTEPWPGPRFQRYGRPPTRASNEHFIQYIQVTVRSGRNRHANAGSGALTRSAPELQRNTRPFRRRLKIHVHGCVGHCGADSRYLTSQACVDSCAGGALPPKRLQGYLFALCPGKAATIVDLYGSRRII